MIDRCADVIVCLVNKILCPFSNDKRLANVPTPNDLDEPRPPVIIKNRVVFPKA
jgi:hypothetical protein